MAKDNMHSLDQKIFSAGPSLVGYATTWLASMVMWMSMNWGILLQFGLVTLTGIFGIVSALIGIYYKDRLEKRRETKRIREMQQEIDELKKQLNFSYAEDYVERTDE